MAIVGSKIFGVCGWVVDNWLTIGWDIDWQLVAKWVDNWLQNWLQNWLPNWLQILVAKLVCKISCNISCKIGCKIGCKKMHWQIFKKLYGKISKKNILTNKNGSSLAEVWCDAG